MLSWAGVIFLSTLHTSLHRCVAAVFLRHFPLLIFVASPDNESFLINPSRHMLKRIVTRVPSFEKCIISK